jgi:hypothetical protein
MHNFPDSRERQALLDWMAAHHLTTPQRAAKAHMALEAAFAAIDELASLGFHCVLSEMDPSSQNAPRLEYPKMVYSDTEGVRTVANAKELADLGPGWWDHPDPKQRKPATEEAKIDLGEKPLPLKVPVEEWPKTEEWPKAKSDFVDEV